MTTTDNIAQADVELRQIIERCREFEASHAAELLAVNPKYRDSARNLVHYLALREVDIRDLQDNLASLGLSSLDRAERNVMASINAVRSALHALAGDMAPVEGAEPGSLDLRSPSAESNKKAILGDAPEGRDVSIMVTLPHEAGRNDSLVAGMLTAGMSVARINCAHDDEDAWSAMIRNVRTASDDTGTDCKIVMDLAGPKIRTGNLRPGPKVFHLRPRRDPMGRIIAPPRLRFIPDATVWP